MDHGKLTDHNGKSVDFRNVILIMTTNAGASDMARPPMGFNRTKREGDDMEAVNRMFTPEFRNRLDAVIPFSGLPPEVIMKVVEKFVFQLEAQLADRGVTIELTEEATKWLAETGYDEKFGARPLARVIQEHIKKPLAEELLFGKLLHGGTVRVLVTGEGQEKKLTFEYIPADPALRAKKAKSEEDDATARMRTARARRWSKHPRARPCQARRTRRTARNRAAEPCRSSRAARTTEAVCVGLRQRA
jgi:ATP-dependent Clp protease ATP-binding subunit ClpA